jgi:hypothetical protein
MGSRPARQNGSQLGAQDQVDLRPASEGHDEGARLDSRHEVMERMTQEAEAKGRERDHRHALRQPEMARNWTEIAPTGTAVRVRKR